MKLKNFDQFLLEKESIEKEINRLADIVRLPYNEFVKELGSEVSDPKFQAAIKAGHIDSDKELEFHAPKYIHVKDLLPTQSEIDLTKSLDFQISGKNKAQLMEILADGRVTIKAPLVTLNGKYIIDGHHRWSQVYAMNDDCQIMCANLQTVDKGIGPLEVLKAVQLSIAAETGRVPTENVEGHNMMTLGKDAIIKYILTKISNECVSVMAEVGVADTVDLAANYIWGNIRDMQLHNQPIKGAPKRDFMPQTDVGGGWDTRLEKGDINFLPKHVDDEK